MIRCSAPRAWCLCWLLLVAALMPLPAAAAQEQAGAAREAAESETTADPNIPVEDLELLVKPLTQEELVIEADAWLALVKAKVAEISATKIMVRELNRQMAALREAGSSTTQPAGDANNPAEGSLEQLNQEKTALLTRETALVEERTALIDRLRVVLDELEWKGGDAGPYHRYIAAVSGIPIDVADAGATWHAIVGWLRSTEGGIRWGINLTWFFATLVVFWILSHVLARGMRQAVGMTKNKSDLLRDFAVNLTRRLTMLVGLLVAVSMLEVKLGPVIAILGGAAFVVAFALQGTLSNFASGLLILAYRPYDVGDVIKGGGAFGTVESMNLVSTHIKSFDNQRIIVPNNAIWNDMITNVTGLPTRRVDMTFGISYSDDIAKATAILEDILKKHPLTLDDPPPMVKLHELGDSSVNFIARPWVKTADYWTVYWDVMRTVKERFDAEGISIPFPQRDVHLYQAPAGA